MNIIPSYDQASAIGQHMTGGVAGRDYTVFQYVQRKSNLTLFGVQVGNDKPIYHF